MTGTRGSLLSLALPLAAAAALALPAHPAAAAPRTVSLAWAACERADLAGFECARLEVPRDWSNPAKGTFSLSMARHRSSGPASQRIGSLFFNPGGPGGSGVDITASVWSILPEETKAHFDLVSFDPRGVGESTPTIDCALTTFATPPATGPVDWAGVYATTQQQSAAANKACLEDNPDVAPYIGTKNVVKDLDAMRAAVGDALLSYWGASYGTRIGYTYALTYPDRFRAILLDGSVNPRGSISDFISGYATAADPALGMVFERYPGSGDDFRSVMAHLQTATVPISKTRSLSRWDVTGYLENSMGSQAFGAQQARYLRWVHTAITGEGKALRNAKRELRSATQAQFLLMGGFPALVNCLDYADRPDAARQQELADAVRFHAPNLGWLRAIQLKSSCDGLEGLVPDPVPQPEGNNYAARLLLLGATRDSQTPYVWSTDMANLFRESRLVTYVGSQHVTYGITGSTCVNSYGTAYLIGQDLPAVDQSCRNVLPAHGARLDIAARAL